MRRYLIAAAAAGGLLLLGGAPARADEKPAPAVDQGGLLGDVLDPAGGVRVPSPLDDSPIVDVKPGTNSVAPPAAAAPAAQAERTAPHTGLGSAPAKPLKKAPATKSDLPVVGGGGLPALGGLPVVGGLLPNGGGLPLTAVPRSATTESGLLGSDLPLIGGLLPDQPARTLPTTVDGADAKSDASGMPPGGTALPPGATDVPAGADAPPATSPGDTPAPAAAGPGDDRKRLHEEPIDDEGANGRPFSDGRPVAGEDPDFN